MSDQFNKENAGQRDLAGAAEQDTVTLRERERRTDEQGYTLRGEHARRWRELARKIAALGDQVSDTPEPVTDPAQRGTLTILGSGIEAVAFTRADETLIRQADEVFFCVADPATSVWLKSIRPDAYDLYVFYNDNKVRYITYMQMTEAMLYHVRQGKTVVGIYYGHPGIFVLSTHRAIAIARREGHNATMRAGISALDSLSADLGVDPSQPGLVTFEATDMLIRQRVLDTGLHVVLWQVGLIGELGYRRQGFLNSGFTILLDHLEKIYGPDYPIVNYVGSRYPGMDPLIDRQTIASLRLPENQTRVTGISTFYIAPRDVRPVDREMLLTLGLIKPGQETTTPATPLREIDKYGAREMLAFKDFENFEVPPGYHWQADTGPARFILAMCRDPKLRAAYALDPRGVVEDFDAPRLSDKNKDLLVQRDPGMAQLAAKGVRVGMDKEAERMFDALITTTGPARKLLGSVRRAADAAKSQAIADWCTKNGFQPELNHIWEDFQTYLRFLPFAWSGCYAHPEGTGPSIVILGRAQSRSPRLWVDGIEMMGVKFGRGSFTWSPEAGNPTTGAISTDLSPRGARRLDGVIWKKGDNPKTEDRLRLLEVLQPRVPLASVAGHYQSDEGQEVRVTADRVLGETRVFLNGKQMDAPSEVDMDGFQLADLRIPAENRLWGEGIPEEYYGVFTARLGRIGSRSLHQIKLNQDGVEINGAEIASPTITGNRVEWISGPEGFSSGDIYLLIDPITLCPIIHGTVVDTASGERSLVAMVSMKDNEREARRAAPDYGIELAAWDALVKIAADSAEQGGLFLWHGWAKAARNLHQTRTALWEGQ